MAEKHGEARRRDDWGVRLSPESAYIIVLQLDCWSWRGAIAAAFLCSTWTLTLSAVCAKLVVFFTSRTGLEVGMRAIGRSRAQNVNEPYLVAI